MFDRPSTSSSSSVSIENHKIAIKAAVFKGEINQIGRAFVEANSNSTFLAYVKNKMDPTYLNVATKMQDYIPRDDVNTLQDHCDFLVNCYLELPNFATELAQHIRQLFEATFQKKLEKQTLIQLISVSTLHDIGREYLLKHPEESKTHTNQELAQTLIACRSFDAETGKCVPPTAKVLWLILLQIYGSLEIEGSLSDRISRMISNVFDVSFIRKQPIYTGYSAAIGGGGGDYIILPMSQIADNVRKAILPRLEKANQYELKEVSSAAQSVKLQ